MKLHRELGVSQESAWFMAHRLRQAWTMWSEEPMEGLAETDTTFMGGKRKNMPKRKRAVLTGQGAVGKTAVAGIKDRRTNEVRAKVVPDSKVSTLRGFVTENVQPDAEIYTDDAPTYNPLPNRQSVNHSHSAGLRSGSQTLLVSCVKWSDGKSWRGTSAGTADCGRPGTTLSGRKSRPVGVCTASADSRITGKNAIAWRLIQTRFSDRMEGGKGLRRGEA